jgi:hypothetical protein
VLTEHIRVCPKHPLRAAEKEIEYLRSELGRAKAMVQAHASLGAAALDKVNERITPLTEAASDFANDYDKLMKKLGLPDARERSRGPHRRLLPVVGEARGRRLRVPALTVIPLGDLIEVVTRRGWDLRLVRPTEKTLAKRRKQHNNAEEKVHGRTTTS